MSIASSSFKFEQISIPDREPDNFITERIAITADTVFVPSDPTTAQHMRIIEVSGTLDFWNDEEEDRYTTDDGSPV